MLKQLIIAATTVAACAQAPISRADVTGTTTVGNFTYTLRDLDPSDGITPSIQFATEQRMTAAMHVWLDIAGGQQDETYEGVWATGNESLSLYESLGPEYWMSGTIEGRETLDTLQLQTTGYTSLPQGSTGLFVASTGWYEFILSPNTEVTFSAIAEVEALPAGMDAGYGYLSRILFQTQHTPYQVAAFFEAANFGDAPPSLDVTQQVTVSATNAHSAPVSNYVHLTISSEVYSRTGVVPIPEPGRLPMLIAGLAVLGGFVNHARHRPVA